MWELPTDLKSNHGEKDPVGIILWQICQSECYKYLGLSSKLKLN